MEFSLETIAASAIAIAVLATSVYAFILSRRTERLNEETERLWKSIMDAHNDRESTEAAKISELIEKGKGRVWNPPRELINLEGQLREAQRRDILGGLYHEKPHAATKRADRNVQAGRGEVKRA